MEDLEELKGIKNAKEFVDRTFRSSFKPVAYYDDRLDCIRVIIRDCSISEFRVNEYLTLMQDNHPDKDTNPMDRYVGFTVKGIRDFFLRKLNHQAQSVEIPELLAQILSSLPQHMENFEAKKLIEISVDVSLSILKNNQVNEEVRLAA